MRLRILNLILILILNIFLITVQGLSAEDIETPMRFICGHLVPSANVQHNITINNAAASVSFVLNWTNEAADLSLILVSPSGAKINRDTKSPLIQHQKVGTVEFYVIRDPDEGNWVLEVHEDNVSLETDYSLESEAIYNKKIGESEGRAQFNRLIFDYGVDLDRDGQYDGITTKIGVNVYSPGIYALNGTLFDVNGSNMYATNQTYLNLGAKFLWLDFFGLNSGEPYHLKDLKLYNSEGDLVDHLDKDYTTHAYGNLEFLKPAQGGAQFNQNYSDYGADLDADGQYDGITAKIGVNVYSDGIYTLAGSLFDINGSNIMNSTNQAHLDLGTKKYLWLDFFGLNSSKPYHLKNLKLYNSKGDLVDHSDEGYTTHAYSNLEFLKPAQGRLTGEYSDKLVDVNKDGSYDIIALDARVDVEIAGEFNLGGELYDQNDTQVGWAIDHRNLSEGLQTMHLDFDNKNLESKNGSFKIKNLTLSSGSSDTYLVPLDWVPVLRNVLINSLSNPIQTSQSARQSEKMISGFGNGEILLTIGLKTMLPVYSGRFGYDIKGLNIPPISSPWTPISPPWDLTGKGYAYSMEGLYLPGKPNNVSISAVGVKDLNIGLRQNMRFGAQNSPQRMWVTSNAVADKNNLATVESDLISPGNYDIKILGDASENTSQVELLMTYVKKIIVKNRFNLSFNTSGFPSGELSIKAKALNGSLTLNELTLDHL